MIFCWLLSVLKSFLFIGKSRRRLRNVSSVHPFLHLRFIKRVLFQAWKAEQEQLQEEEMVKRLKTPKSKGKQQKEAQASAEKDKDLSGGKKSRPNTAGFQREAPKEPMVRTEPTEEPSKVRTLF